jgi:hypothetical protein
VIGLEERRATDHLPAELDFDTNGATIRRAEAGIVSSRLGYAPPNRTTR